MAVNAEGEKKIQASLDSHYLFKTESMRDFVFHHMMADTECPGNRK